MPLMPRLLPRQLQLWLTRSIAHRIGFAAAVLIGSFVLAIGLVSIVLMLTLMRDSVRAEMRSEAALAEERLSRSLSRTVRSIELLAQSTLVTNALVDSSGRTSYLEPHLREYRLADEAPFVLSLTDHTGQLIASNREGVTLPRSAEWIRRQVEKNSPLAEIQGGDQPRLLLTWPVLFPATNTPEGMLLLDLILTPLAQRALMAVIDDTAVTLNAGERGTTVIQHGPPHRAGVTINRPLMVPPPLEQLDLQLVTTRSWTSAYGSLFRMTLVYSVLAVLALVLAVQLARRVAQRLVAPLRELTRAADRQRHDGSTAVNFPASGEDEVGQLGAALQHLVEQLRTEQGLLEQRVAERTAEINDLAYIVRRTHNGVVVMDPQGRIEWVNEAFSHITGYSLEEMRGRMPEDLLRGTGSDQAVGRQMRESLQAGVGYAAEILNYHKSGRPFWISIDAQPILDDTGRIVKWVALETDITERKRVEQLKTDFVSVVSHELRTPLTAIRGALGLLDGGVAGELPPTAREMTRLALSNSERLTRLINDLLDIQKLESGKMVFELKDCPLPQLLAEAMTANQPYAQKYQVQILTEGTVPAVTLQVDEGRFQQVMANLLSNAAKFSPAGEVVRVTTHVTTRTDDKGAATEWLQLRVIDHGVGIPEEFRSRVFQKFSQADASDTRAKDGTGLGLSITQALVRHMGGTISFETVPGIGTTFQVELPVRNRPVAGPAHPV